MVGTGASGVAVSSGPHGSCGQRSDAGHGFQVEVRAVGPAVLDDRLGAPRTDARPAAQLAGAGRGALPRFRPIRGRRAFAVVEARNGERRPEAREHGDGAGIEGGMTALHGGKDRAEAPPVRGLSSVTLFGSGVLTYSLSGSAPPA